VLLAYVAAKKKAWIKLVLTISYHNEIIYNHGSNCKIMLLWTQNMQ
jgi:hypothetical protein